MESYSIIYTYIFRCSVADGGTDVGWRGTHGDHMEMLSSPRCPRCRRVLSDRKSRYTGVVRAKRGTRIEVAFFFSPSFLSPPYFRTPSFSSLEAARAEESKGLSRSAIFSSFGMILLSVSFLHAHLTIICYLSRLSIWSGEKRDAFKSQESATEVGVR